MIRELRKTSFSPPITLSLFLFSLSLAFRKKDARPSSPEKHVGRSRKKTPPNRRWDRRAFGTVGVSRKSSSEGTNRVLFFLCLHGERLKVFSLSSSCPPPLKKNQNPKPATSLPFFSPIFVILDWILSKVGVHLGVGRSTRHLRIKPTKEEASFRKEDRLHERGTPREKRDEEEKEKRMLSQTIASASSSSSSSPSAASLASRRSVKNASLKKMSSRNMERNRKATDRRRGVVQTCAKKTEDGPRVCIAGVTGAVGQEFLRVLKQRDFPYSEMKMLASARSAGKKVEFDGETYTTEELTESSFDNMDIALFSAGGSISKKFGPIAVEKGCFVVDNSSAFRMTEGVPLVIPEVNPEAMSGMKVGFGKGGIIANPNCSTIIALMATTAIQRKVGIERMVVSTYQAASGAGAQAMAELEQQTKELVNEGEIKTKDIFPWGYAFNLFSHNAPMMDNGYNEEEMKMVNETKKIWNTDDITIAATCIRVPVMRAHAESINLTLKNELSEEEARQLISDFPGASLIDDRANNRFPMPSDASDQDDCFVGRIRRDISQKGNKGLELFVCGDQIRKGAAQNAVQVAELLL